ncbi:MAG TPA: response regulator transcription factor [Candidatus Avoscillospira avistercoris]|uniref:Stage 0 sporulation protein A homolog n=1 Tax=Candidatus Avoscillospira avistercoris TaxID=2840707 RepID=A0A9D1F9V8_9FIRM|nr:response regulator transcription factor [Candidatus Avoscillospira avistercoris]
MRILVAEDEQDLNRLMVQALERAGYSVDSCYDGADALDYAAGADYDCILLDIMMPKADGRTVLRTLRSRGCAVPVIFLTALDSVQDRIDGLDLGADDYLVKPFDMAELLARIRAATRKYGGQKTTVLTAGDLSLDTVTHGVTRAGQTINLSAKEYAILEYLLRNKGAVLSRAQLENHIWNYDYAGGSNVVDVYIAYLRKKVDAPFDKKLIHTVRGAGWVLREE